MRFAIERTSLRGEQPPCRLAIEGELDRWDYRTFKSAEEHDAKLGDRFGGRWHDRGTDHGLILGPRGGVHGIKRKLGKVKAWFVDVDSLDDLVRLFEEYGDLVITTNTADGMTPTIEIYDTYRE